MVRRDLGRLTGLLLLAGVAAVWAPPLRAQETPAPGGEPSAPTQPGADENASDPATTVFPHSESSRFWISGQMNLVFQWHPAFRAKYSGPNSLTPLAQSSTTHILTLYTDYRLTPTTEVLADVEDSTGGGIGGALGLAGFTDLDAVRTVQGFPLSKAPYLARLMLRQIIPLSGNRVTAGRGPFGVISSLPQRRLEFRIGKFSLVDFFDANSAGSDSHLQFLNWTVGNNGAWDYAANTRGYTDGAVVEYDDVHWSLRFAEALMPKLANGIHLDADLSRARSENTEFELRKRFLPHRDGVIRLLSYVNHGNMGDYRVAVRQFEAGLTSVPDITNHPRQTTIKYGFGANLEQEVTPWLTAFGRFGWNEGRHELFAYTEVNQSVSFGAAVRGIRWRRPLDRAGAAFASNALSGDHRRYLALGGLGFILGDGRLNYGREKIFETFYTAHAWRGVFASVGFQHVTNPGYNRDRGPVLVPMLRLHLEL